MPLTPPLQVAGFRPVGRPSVDRDEAMRPRPDRAEVRHPVPNVRFLSRSGDSRALDRYGLVANLEVDRPMPSSISGLGVAARWRSADRSDHAFRRSAADRKSVV